MLCSLDRREERLVPVEIHAFAAAKAEFQLHLRPTQIKEAVIAGRLSIERSDIETALQQLESWGTLLTTTSILRVVANIQRVK